MDLQRKEAEVPRRSVKNTMIVDFAKRLAGEHTKAHRVHYPDPVHIGASEVDTSAESAAALHTDAIVDADATEAEKQEFVFELQADLPARSVEPVERMEESVLERSKLQSFLTSGIRPHQYHIHDQQRRATLLHLLVLPIGMY